MRSRRLAPCLLSLLGMAILFSQLGLAQTVNGSFRGTVTDQSNSAVPAPR